MLTLQHACRILRRNNRRKQATLISKLRKAVRISAYLSLRIYSMCSCGFIGILCRRYIPKLSLPARYLSVQDIRERCNREVFRSLHLRSKTFGVYESLSSSS